MVFFRIVAEGRLGSTERHWWQSRGYGSTKPVTPRTPPRLGIGAGAGHGRSRSRRHHVTKSGEVALDAEPGVGATERVLAALSSTVPCAITTRSKSHAKIRSTLAREAALSRVASRSFAPRPSVCATGHPSHSRTLGLAASDSFCRDRPALRHTTSLSLARAFAQ